MDLPTLDWGDYVVTVMLSLSGVIGLTGLRAGAEGFDHLQQQARREQRSTSAGGRGVCVFKKEGRCWAACASIVAAFPVPEMRRTKHKLFFWGKGAHTMIPSSTIPTPDRPSSERKNLGACSLTPPVKSAAAGDGTSNMVAVDCQIVVLLDIPSSQGSNGHPPSPPPSPLV